MRSPGRLPAILLRRLRTARSRSRWTARTRSRNSSESCTRVYYAKQCRVPIVRARFQNVYGPGEILGAGRWRGTPATVWRNVTPTFVFKSLEQESLPLEGGGHASRDFIFVDDMAEGLVAMRPERRTGRRLQPGEWGRNDDSRARSPDRPRHRQSDTSAHGSRSAVGSFRTTLRQPRKG